MIGNTPTFSTTVTAWGPPCDPVQSQVAGACVDEWGIRLYPLSPSVTTTPVNNRILAGIDNSTLYLIAAIAAIAIVIRRTN